MAKVKAIETPTTEEFQFRSDNAFLSLLLNRRTGLIRVIDYRAGSQPSKRLFIQSVAKREGASKILTLVEKDEVSAWTRVGFHREGSIPGFYKRSDGYLCGCVVGEKASSEAPTYKEAQETRAKAADRTIQLAKRAAEDLKEDIGKGLQVETVSSEEALSARDEAWKKEKPIGAFDPFGRDAESIFMQVSARQDGRGPRSRQSKVNYACAEYQDCFGHAFVEVLFGPATSQDVAPVIVLLRTLNDYLRDRGIISAFAFSASDDVPLATAFFAAGFRKTGLVEKGVVINGVRQDAILWAQKLANPAADDDDAALE